jgi:hypothetical protein
MHLLAVFFRILLYVTIAALIAVNFHFYMLKRSDEARARESLAAVQTASQDTLPPSTMEQLPRNKGP